MSPRVVRGVSVVACALVVATACCAVTGAVGDSGRISVRIPVGLASALAALFAGLAFRAPRASFRWSLLVGALTGGITAVLMFLDNFVEPDPDEGSVAPFFALFALVAGVVFGVALALLLGLIGYTLRAGDSDDARDASDEVLARASAWLVFSGGPLSLLFLQRGYLGAIGMLTTTTGAALALFVVRRDVSRWRLLARIVAGTDPRWVMIDTSKAISRPLPPYVRSDPARWQAALAARQLDGPAFRGDSLPAPAIAIDTGARLARSLLRRRAVLTSIVLVVGVAFPITGSVVSRGDPAIKPIADQPVDAPMLGSQPYRIDLEGPAADLVMSDTTACAVLRSSNVQCWGRNEGHFPGLPRYIEEPTMLPWIAGVRAIALGGGHACAIEDGGLVSCWGKGTDGQLGDGERVDREMPVPVVGLGEVTQLALAGNRSCALAKSGAVHCWGTPSQSDPGCGDDVSRAAVAPWEIAGLRGIDEISTQFSGFYARDTAGQISAVGRSPGLISPARCVDAYVAIPIVLPSPARQVSGGPQGGCALLRNGGAACWGFGPGNTCQARGFGPYDEANLHGAAAVAVGGEFTCSLAAGGTVSCWGFCGFRRGGIRTGTGTPIPVPGLDGVERLAAGLDVACALRRDGSVWCWGDTATWTR